MMALTERPRPFRILGLADLHDRIGMLEQLGGTDADLILFCGDLHNAGTIESARAAAFSLAGLGPPVLIVPGNMDHRDFAPLLWERAGLRMLHRSACRIGEIGFLGMGGMVARDLRRLGDPARYYHRDDEVYEALKEAYCSPEISDVSVRVRIVAVHQPPRGAQDTLYNGESSGSVGLLRFVLEYSPDLLLCGHIHEAQGECFLGRTKVVNVGELRAGHAALLEIGEEISLRWIELSEGTACV